MSSSGLTPSMSSARADQVTPSSESAPLPLETLPEPLIRSPSQIARAYLSAMLVPLFLAGARRSIVRLAFQRLREMVDLEAAWIGVRIDVALPASELFRTVVVRVAELVGRSRVAELAHVLRRLAECSDDGVRLRRERAVDRRLGQV